MNKLLIQAQNQIKATGGIKTALLDKIQKASKGLGWQCTASDIERDAASKLLSAFGR